MSSTTYNPTLKDRLRLAIGLLTLETKPVDCSLEYYVLQLQQRFSTNTPRPNKRKASVFDIDQNLGNRDELSWTDTVKELEQQVEDLQRELALRDAAPSTPQPKKAPAKKKQAAKSQPTTRKLRGSQEPPNAKSGPSTPTVEVSDSSTAKPKRKRTKSEKPPIAEEIPVTTKEVPVVQGLPNGPMKDLVDGIVEALRICKSEAEGGIGLGEKGKVAEGLTGRIMRGLANVKQPSTYVALESSLSTLSLLLPVSVTSLPTSEARERHISVIASTTRKITQSVGTLFKDAISIRSSLSTRNPRTILKHLQTLLLALLPPLLGRLSEGETRSSNSEIASLVIQLQKEVVLPALKALSKISGRVYGGMKYSDTPTRSNQGEPQEDVRMDDEYSYSMVTLLDTDVRYELEEMLSRLATIVSSPKQGASSQYKSSSPFSEMITLSATSELERLLVALEEDKNESAGAQLTSHFAKEDTIHHLVTLIRSCIPHLPSRPSPHPGLLDCLLNDTGMTLQSKADDLLGSTIRSKLASILSKLFEAKDGQVIAGVSSLLLKELRDLAGELMLVEGEEVSRFGCDGDMDVE